MNNRTLRPGINKFITLLTAAVTLFTFGGCSSSAQVTSNGMVKVGSLNVETPSGYTDESPSEEPVSETVSDNGLCTIVRYPSYYGVTLDYEKGTPSDVGAAYAET
ncbi:MAG: hypothetical protein J6Z21_00735, partial [Lachnospiraceae bacterium]|nr:hypothetical protein [Lachnospiraceae bacterium]